MLVAELESDEIVSGSRDEFIQRFLCQNLYDKSGQVRTSLRELCQTTLVGLYFDAGWSSPGRTYLPTLREFYNHVVDKNVNFEIVYVSFDDTEAECLSTFQQDHGNWLRWPFDKQNINELKSFLDVTYLPSLFIISPKFQIISPIGRKELTDRGLTALLYWDELRRNSLVRV